MTRALDTYLDGTHVGTLTQSTRGALGFSYDPAHLASEDPTPLSLSLPLSATAHSNKAVRAYIEGLLPDNPLVRERWGRTYGVSPNNPFALLEHVGRDAAGAVQVVAPGEQAPDASERAGDVDWLDADALTAMLRDLAASRGDWFPGRDTGRWSLAGAQSKVALFREPGTGRWGIPRDATPTTHILKPALAAFHDHHINEVICQRAASALGLPAAAVDLIEGDGVRAMVSTRYDRAVDAAGRLRRLHQEDLCQAMAVQPDRKYQSDGGPGVGEVADLFLRLEVTDRRVSASRFFDALAFNVLIGGTDAHAKNYSLLLQGRRTQLAPLYDLASAAPYDSGPPLQSAMKMGEHWSMRTITARDWAKAGQRLGLSAGQATDRVADLRTNLPRALDLAVGSLPESAQRRGAAIVDRIALHLEALPH